MAPRSQSTRDIMRQEAKLQEMQEEVRRREMRGGVTSPQHYPLQPGGHSRPQVRKCTIVPYCAPSLLTWNFIIEEKVNGLLKHCVISRKVGVRDPVR